MRISILLPLTLLAACGNKLSDPAFPTGSQTIIGSADQKGVYVVDTDEGKLQFRHLASNEVTELEVGKEPMRVARAGGKIFVTLRGEGALAVVSHEDGKLVLEEKIPLGTEPVGVVASEDGSRVYVALSTQNEVVELNGKSLEVVRSWKIDNQPTWLALRPDGSGLYVACAYQGGLHWVDLTTGEREAISLGSRSGAGTNGNDSLSFRITGDPSVSATGDLLVVPSLYVDNITPVEEPEAGEVSGGYGSASSLEISRFNPAVERLPLGGGGKPEMGDATSIFTGGFGLDNTVRSYLTSAVISPDGETILATMEASNTVVVISNQPLYGDPASDLAFDSGGFIEPSAVGFASAAMVFTSVDAGPRGVAFVGDEAYVHSFLERTVGPIWLESAARLITDQVGEGSTGEANMAAPMGHSMGASSLAPDVEAGRKLFYSATTPQMAASGAGVSCSTCHYEVRNDGLTWTFTTGVRQSPMLAGQATLTAPVTWTSNVPSVAAEATITSQGRMGGDNLTTTQAEQIQAFVGSVRPVIVPMQGSTDAAVARGEEIFNRTEVGCGTCHDPNKTFQDGDSHDMFGLTEVNTPTLVGIAASAPYLHHGQATTLMDVLEMSRSGEMGDTSSLSDSEMEDLEAYLRSL